MRTIETNVRKPFGDPVVCILVYKESLDAAEKRHREICRKTYKTLTCDWAHTPIQYGSESINSYAYFAFRTEADLLSFMLTQPERTTRVYLWVNSEFTVHQFKE